MADPVREQSIADAYDRWSATYDTDANATRDLDAEVLRRQRFELGGREVLELGCGTGKNTRWLAEVARAVVALDFSEGMLRKAQARTVAANVRFHRHDLRVRWPVADGSQDLVVGNLVLEHIEDLRPIFREAFRVLRRGGQLFLCELHPFRQLQGAQAKFTRIETGEVERVTAYVHDVSEYLNAGTEAGLLLQEVGEWRDPGAAPPAVPRLFSSLWRRPR